MVMTVGTIFVTEFVEATVDVYLLALGFFNLKCKFFIDLLYVDLAEGLDLWFYRVQ